MRTLLLLLTLPLSACAPASAEPAPAPEAYPAPAPEVLPTRIVFEGDAMSPSMVRVSVFTDTRDGTRCYALSVVYEAGGISCLPAPSGAAVEAGR